MEEKIGNKKEEALTTPADFSHRVSRSYSQACPQPMKIKSEQIDRFLDQLLKIYKAKELVILKAKESDIRNKIKNIIAQNFQEEENIEEEARKLMASYAGQVKEMDHYKMFVLIKQKLAEKKGFIL